ncbi:MAG: hypothetical protein KDF58_02375 [Alphaproteobacteria bacterium]|nr:hypothetical protein [Alphaproteobacteria bacterium]HPF46748.1 hypothetical protein [Emcibacteraceae bacterium]
MLDSPVKPESDGKGKENQYNIPHFTIFHALQYSTSTYPFTRVSISLEAG